MNINLNYVENNVMHCFCNLPSYIIIPIFFWDVIHR